MVLVEQVRLNALLPMLIIWVLGWARQVWGSLAVVLVEQVRLNALLEALLSSTPPSRCSPYNVFSKP